MRLMVSGTAGTGKSRTIRAIVNAVQSKCRRWLEQNDWFPQLRATEASAVSISNNSCTLAAPTGCAAYNMKFGAATAHRTYGINPVGYCGPSARNTKTFAKRYEKMLHSVLHVLDEMSMLGQLLVGKILYKVQDILGTKIPEYGKDLPRHCLAGRDVILAGDKKQAPSIGDAPLYKPGEYKGKAMNLRGRRTMERARLGFRSTSLPYRL